MSDKLPMTKIFAAWLVTTVGLMIVTAVIALPFVPVVAGIMIAPVWFLARSNRVYRRNVTHRHVQALSDDLRHDYDASVYNDGGVVLVYGEPSRGRSYYVSPTGKVEMPEPDRNCARCGVNIIHHVLMNHAFEEIEDLL